MSSKLMHNTVHALWQTLIGYYEHSLKFQHIFTPEKTYYPTLQMRLRIWIKYKYALQMLCIS